MPQIPALSAVEPEHLPPPDSVVALADSAPAASLVPDHPLAARRLAYAHDAMADKDFAAAIDILEQTLELCPGSALVWFRLGEVLAAAGRAADAASAFRQTMQFDAQGLLGAALHLSRLGVTDAPPQPPVAYVRGLFDDYAHRFETHLTQKLDYHGPEQIVAALEAVKPGAVYSAAIDLGCGTGLMAKALDARCVAICGCDLAPKMVAIAERTGLYTHVAVADAADFLATHANACADLLLAADVFVYVGDLSDIFAQGARVIVSGGLFAFTVQSSDGTDGAEYCIGEDLRYAHTPAGLMRLARDHGFAVKVLEPAVLRKDRGQDVASLTVVLERD
jgi:predicted TPR repeat methyltransferase